VFGVRVKGRAENGRVRPRQLPGLVARCLLEVAQASEVVRACARLHTGALALSSLEREEEGERA